MSLIILVATAVVVWVAISFIVRSLIVASNERYFEELDRWLRIEHARSRAYGRRQDRIWLTDWTDDIVSDATK